MLDSDFILGRHKRGWKRYYIVLLDGVSEYDGQTLSRCLRFIGKEMKGTSFGAGMVRAAAARAAGYTIETYMA